MTVKPSAGLTAWQPGRLPAPARPRPTGPFSSNLRERKDAEAVRHTRVSSADPRADWDCYVGWLAPRGAEAGILRRRSWRLAVGKRAAGTHFGRLIRSQAYVGNHRDPAWLGVH
jgi:hypothetical protein